MMRPDIQTVPSFYKAYVEYVREMDLKDALQSAGDEVTQMIRSIPEEKGGYRYATGKWSIKEVLNHMMDAERVFAYRALRFSRNDKSALRPFDENAYALQANAASRTVPQLGAEMQRLRASTIDLFSSFSNEMMKREGTASDKVISVLHLGYIIAGHDIHHRKIILERYLNT